MASLPPKAFEKVVGSLMPPACREEVLGDLCERYESPGQYVLSAIPVIPFVIVSRIRRTADPQHLAISAMLDYAAMLCAAWWLDKPFLNSEWGLVKLFVPSLETVVFGMFEAAWRKPSSRRLHWISNLANSAFNVLILFRIIPAGVLIMGSAASLVALGAFELLVPPPPVGIQSVGEATASPEVLSKTTRGALKLVIVALASGVLLVSAGMKPGLVSIVILIEAIVLGTLRKE
jgi:hypothetical protein